MIIEIRKCSRCGESKPLDRFGSHKGRRDGLACWCKDCLNENSRKWHAANRERALVRHREWYGSSTPDRELVAARSREWRKANPGKARLLSKNYKHRRRAKTRGGMTGPELREWEAQQAKVCRWCGVECDAYEIDHRTPLAKGGEHERSNLVISCRTCNRRKAARCPVEFAQSLGKSL